MTRFDSNPYAPAASLEPPAEPSANAIPFSGTVQWEDLECFGREGTGLYAGFLALTTTAVLYCGIYRLQPDLLDAWLGTNRQWIDNLPGWPLLLTLLVAQAVVCGWLTMRFIGYLFVRMNVAAAPELLGPLSGDVTFHSLVLQYPFVRKVISHEAIGEVRKSRVGIGLLLGETRKSLLLLPRRLFEEQDFVRACERIENAYEAEQPALTSPTDAVRATTDPAAPPNLGALSAEAEQFTGGLLLSDCHWAPAYRKQTARIYGVFGCALINVIMMFFLMALLSPINLVRWHVFGTVLGLILLFLVVHIVAAFWRFYKIMGSTLTHVSGWIDKDGLTVNTPLASVTYLPAAFRRVEAGEHSVQLTLSEPSQQTLVLSRPMFVNAVGFERLRAWLAV